MRKIYIPFLCCTAALLGACSDEETFHPDYQLTIEADTTMAVTVSDATPHQTIDGFGSSDAWDMEYVGRYWSDQQKSAIAKMLFSQEIDNGQPEGIGLSQWRVNIGGGTAEQGSDSGIADDSKERRVECYLSADGSYNWSKCPGQRYFMEQAKKYGVQDFVFFSNTPPVYYTKNGKGFSNSGDQSNLRDDCYDKFGDFLATVAEHFQQAGYPVTYISPVNEPQYNWDGGQEGSGWQNSQVARVARSLDAALTAHNLSDTKMLLAEAGKWNYLYETAGDAGSGRSRVADDFFDSSSPNYIGSLKHMPALLCAHSYWLDTSWDELQRSRQAAADVATKHGLKLWQTEWSMLSDRYDFFENYDAASYMDLALAMSEVMHNDLTVANVSSWSYWTSCSCERWSQKSRFYLIRLVPQSGDYGQLTEGGTASSGKNLWVLGNYSLFIRPGYQRIDITLPITDHSLFASAYVSPEKDKLVVVITNTKHKSVKVEPTITIGGKTAENPVEYVTSNTLDLKRVPNYETTILPARSVSTLVYDLK